VEQLFAKDDLVLVGQTIIIETEGGEMVAAVKPKEKLQKTVDAAKDSVATPVDF
jgi:hypothetical protein